MKKTIWSIIAVFCLCTVVIAANTTEYGGSIPATCSGGTCETPDNLVAKSIYDTPLLGSFNKLYNTHAAIGRIVNGTASSQHVLAIIGDSWVTPQSFITSRIISALGVDYGGITLAGSGWRSFVDLAVTGGPTMATTGTWTNRGLAYGDGSVGWGANIQDVTSLDVATPGKKTLVGTAQTIIIHYLKQPGGGTFTYAVDSGEATAVDTSNATYATGTVTISGLSNASHTLDCIVTVAGTAGVTLFGADFQITSNGVRVHVLGNAGAKASDWIAPNASVWQAGIKALAPQTVLIVLDSNEHNGNVAPTTYGANLQTLVTNLRSAVPNIDIIIATTPENGFAATYAMSLYAAQARSVAALNNCEIIDWYNWFGSYALTNSLSLWNDNTHPNASGAAVLVNKFIQQIYPRPSAFYSSVIGAGGVTTTGNAVAANLYAAGAGLVLWNGRSVMASPSNGTIKLTNGGGTDFTTLYLGPNTASFPAFTVTSGATPIVTIADGAGGTAARLSLSGGSAGKAMCWKSDGTQGYCSGSYSDGACTCN